MIREVFRGNATGLFGPVIVVRSAGPKGLMVKAREPATEPIVVAACAIALLPLVIACHRKPEGVAEFQASRAAMQKVATIAIQSTTQTDRGTFRGITEVACPENYYHHRYVTDLSPKGIEQDTTQSQERPRAHQESEDLCVDGKWYRRDDARPEWSLSPSHEKKDVCGSLHHEEDGVLVPYGKILAAAKIEFTGRRDVEGTQCHEFQVTYPATVYGDKMITRDLGNGSSTSRREEVTKPVQARVCIGVEDKLLYEFDPPESVTSSKSSVLYSYKGFTRLAVPAVPAQNER